jgi:signal transduction histidine kinase/CheY-like chemotaxis protein
MSRSTEGRDDEEMLRAEQTAAVYRSATPGTYGSMFAAAVLSGMLVYTGAVETWAAVLFNGLVFASSIARLLLLRAYARAPDQIADWRKWSIAITASALAGGIAWGSASILLMDPVRIEFQLMVILVCAGLSAGAISTFGTYTPTYYANLFPIMVPTIIWATLVGTPLHWAYAILCTLWIFTMALIARTFNRILTNSLRLQFENLSLANGLRRQKDVAEEANLAKSRFLAAASHDLRQPVHALSMFVGALRGFTMEDSARHLVTQIEGSVSSLDGLFNSILDVSRLDAGVVDVRPRAFAIRPMLERICREERPAIGVKSVELRLVPCGATVRTDPVLLERILRNLISNAIKYTERGRIVVGCRRGTRLSVEVWDSGTGIAGAERDRIFEEFYQVGNPERSRERGLGLGLAIVRRLSALLATPVKVESWPGRGSVFRLSVPLAAAAAQAVDEVEPVAAAAGYLDEPLTIFVVDDERQIRDATQALLGGWGHSVITASSGDALFAQIGDEMKPDLIISDYRLNAGENGIDTVKRIRARFDDDIPAILITGDTAPDRLREAVASECLLMHKPISNARLRAAIANLTAPRDELPA